MRNHSSMSELPSLKERFQYLRLDGSVGEETFGFDRYVNQRFYTSREWKAIRDLVIVRDNGCDLGVPGHEISGKVYIHHMNPIRVKDISDTSRTLMDPEYLVCVSHKTHNAIHYGDEKLLDHDPVERNRNDTCPWKKP